MKNDFRMLQGITLVVTLALVLFTLWISDGVKLGRFIAAGVLALGFMQWFALRRFAHQMAANDAAALDEDASSG
ncbi:MAG: hypothetical protein AAF311_11850 [Pseudomonadota bacterium]